MQSCFILLILIIIKKARAFFLTLKEFITFVNIIEAVVETVYKTNVKVFELIDWGKSV